MRVTIQCIKNTIGKTLPDSLIKAPKKSFGIPLREWFKDESFNSKLDRNLFNVKEVLNPESVNKIITENNSGQRDNGSFIWQLIMLNKYIQ